VYKTVSGNEKLRKDELHNFTENYEDHEIKVDNWDM
jgi:hypothetical protein